MSEQKQLPNPEQVRLIFKDTYLFYDKYIKLESVDWGMFHKEYTELCNKYPFDLTIKIVTELVQLIGLQKGGL